MKYKIKYCVNGGLLDVLDGGKVLVSLPNEVPQATGGGHNDLWAPAEQASLLLRSHSAKHGNDLTKKKK